MIACPHGLVLAFALATPAFAQTPLVEEGDPVGGVGNVSSISNFAINDSGDWLVEVDTDNANTDIDAALLANGALYLQEGQALAMPLAATLDSFDAITLDNSGASAFNFFLDNTVGGLSDDSGIYLGTQLLIQEGDFATAAGLSASTPYTGFFETKINDGGTILLMASVDDPAIASTTDRALVLIEEDGGGGYTQTLVAAEGTLLSGQVEPVADFQTGPHAFALNDLGDVMFVADLAGSTATDGAVYLNDELLAQEGSASPVAGTNWTVLSSAEVDLNDACEHVYSGSISAGAGATLLIVKNGAKFRQSGDSLAAISPFAITSFGSGPVKLANSGDVLWYGDWDDPNTGQDTGLFVNDTLIVQEGVTTIGGVAVQTVRGIQDGYTISKNGRYIVFEAVLANGVEGAYLIDRGEVAWQEVRNGTGANPLCLKALSTPQLGGTWSVTVDSSVAPSATAVVLEARALPSGPTSIALGELLIDVGSQRLLSRTFPATGGLQTFHFPIPNDPTLTGRTGYFQAAVLGSPGQLCNALDSTAGL